jgi:hypothetical protein
MNGEKHSARCFQMQTFGLVRANSKEQGFGVNFASRVQPLQNGDCYVEILLMGASGDLVKGTLDEGSLQGWRRVGNYAVS